LDFGYQNHELMKELVEQMGQMEQQLQHQLCNMVLL
jgi:hypothetical protein